jgi:ATP-dependent helicase/nuclease subunit A
MSDTASLAGFLAWFDAGDGELKREAGASPELVRVMTAHGSKGLQAPIVILADATGDPKAGFGPAAELDDPADPSRVVPLPPLRKEERIGRIAARHEDALRAEEEEHWRLLYVAMTRAEEALFIGGALGRRAKGEVPAGSWFAKLRELFGPDDWVDDPLFGIRLEWGTPPAMGGPRVAGKDQGSVTVLPVWLTGPPPEEPRPPRPLAPSRLGEDVSADPPFASGSNPAAMRAAARRGVLVHGLLERLPDVPPEARAMAGERWLMRNGAELAPGDRDELLASALAVLDDPGFADLFLPGSLAEVPIAALVGGRVVAGTIDRLLVERERILVVDYKTARRPPADLAGVPVSIMRQMAAYAAALTSWRWSRASKAFRVPPLPSRRAVLDCRKRKEYRHAHQNRYRCQLPGRRARIRTARAGRFLGGLVRPVQDDRPGA